MPVRARRLATAAITTTTLATASLIVAVPAAHAADATHTAVTSVSGPQFRQYNDDTGSPAMEIKGTSNGDAAATFDLRCYYGPGSGDYSNLANNVSFASDGSFDVLARSSNIEGDTCVIRAIPRTGTTQVFPTTFTSFTGPLVGGGDYNVLNSYRYSDTDLSGGQPYGYYIESSQRSGDMAWESAGQCGLDYAYLYDSSGAPAGNPVYQHTDDFVCAGYLPNDVAVGTANHRSALQVDGVNAVTPFGAESLDGTRAPAVTVTVVHDPTTGDQVITESDPLVACADPTYPLTAAHCATYTSTGIRLDRVIMQGASGRLGSVRDSFVSTDGKDHNVSAIYENDMDNTSTHLGYRIPWTSSGTTFAAHTTGDAIGAAPAGPGSIEAINDTTADPSLQNPVTALTYSVPPSAVLFGSASTYYLTYTRHVAAGGANGLTQTFSQGASQNETDSYAGAAINAYRNGLKVTLTGVPTTTATKALTIHGTFSGGANGLPSTATVGVGTAQQTVPVAPNGTFSANVTLQPGPNSIAVTGTDDAGLQGATSALVTYANPVTTSAPKVSKKTVIVKEHILRGLETVKVRKVSKVTITDVLSCASFATSPCTGVVTVTAGGHTIARKAYVLAPGTSGKLTLTVSKSAVNAINRLKRHKHLNAGLFASYNDPAGGVLLTTPRTFRLA